MTNEEFKAVIASTIREFQPKTRVIEKKNSPLHKVIARIMFFMPYMRFSTTIGNTIALAEHADWHTLAHEGKHVIQSKKQTRLLHSILYLFPQILVLGSVVALLNPWFLLFLLCGLPIPAYCRMVKELEAYEVSITVLQWSNGYVPLWRMEYITKNFTGWNYYLMWPFKDYIMNRLLIAADRARYWGENNKDHYLNKILTSMRTCNMLHPKGINER